MTARVSVTRKLPSSITVGILVVLLLGSSVSCSRQAAPEPVTLCTLCRTQANLPGRSLTKSLTLFITTP
jgi:hypothetical protein